MPKKKILIVDDEPMILNAYRDHLEREGYDVDVAHDGIEGLDKLKQSKPDLVLLDIIMPVMDGITMLENLRAIKGMDSLPVVFLTNLNTPESVAKALKVGSTQYLVKVNYSLDDLSKKVKEIMSA